MTHLLGLVVVIGFLDSLNPSTIAPALFIAAGERPQRNLAAFIAGVFFVNLAGGLVLALGPGQALLALVPHPSFEVRRELELALGIVILAVAGWLWLARHRVATRVSGKGDRIDRSSLLVGAGISAAELPTAVPYFAVIAAVVASGRPLQTQVALLVVFNLVFIAPLLAILLVRSVLPESGQRVIQEMRARLDQSLGIAIPALVGLVAIVLTVRGTLGLLHHH
jgi:cytochrome c biogenesis protein CcdA